MAPFEQVQIADLGRIGQQDRDRLRSRGGFSRARTRPRTSKERAGQAFHSDDAACRLAVDLNQQKQGAGAALVKDATRRTLQAADIAGIRALVVHAKR